MDVALVTVARRSVSCPFGNLDGLSQEISALQQLDIHSTAEYIFRDYFCELAPATINMGKKAAKEREPSPSSSSSSESSADQAPSVTSTEPTKKRKRAAVPEGEELEIDVTAPEPLSKKELRKAKKSKTTPATTTPTVAGASSNGATEALSDNTGEPKEDYNPNKRSLHGIWIGNLPFSCDKAALRTFLLEQGGIIEPEITRVHMPAPPNTDAKRMLKPQNKGFAYVDFTTRDVVERAIALSEKLILGRRCLIKDARSFEGRPEKKAEPADGAAAVAGAPVSKTMGFLAENQKPPSKRVFVGNLGFDVTKEDLEQHYGQAGEIEDVHMATFEDTGKCKGFAWVRFVELEAAESAVKGYFWKEEKDSDDEDEESEEEDSSSEDGSEDDAEKPKKASKKAKTAKKVKKRKWFVNRLNGRTLRCEFAEDAATRYKKRYGKGARAGADGASGDVPLGEVDGDAGAGGHGRRRQRGDKEQREQERRNKHRDARTIKPGAALANAPRASGAIVAAAGKKISFDE